MATNYYDDEDDDFINDEPQDVVKQLRKVNRALEKRLKEIEVEASTLKTQTRQRVVKDVLTAKGVNPKVAAFIPQDVEASEEAVAKWLDDYGDVFGIKSEPNKEETQAPNPALQASTRINDVMSSGQAPAYDDDVMGKIANAKSAAELNAILGISVQ